METIHFSHNVLIGALGGILAICVYLYLSRKYNKLYTSFVSSVKNELHIIEEDVEAVFVKMPSNLFNSLKKKGIISPTGTGSNQGVKYHSVVKPEEAPISTILPTIPPLPPIPTTPTISKDFLDTTHTNISS